MRWNTLIAWIAIVIMPTVLSRATEPTDDQRPGRGGIRVSPHPRDDGDFIESEFLGRSGWACFRLSGGRLELDPMRYRKGDRQGRGQGFEERISVSASKGVPSVCYQYRDAFQQIRVGAEHGRSIQIESTLLATGERGVLVQEAGQPIRWTVEQTPGSKHALDLRLQTETWIHLVGHDPAGFELHLERIVTAMLSGRSIRDLAHQTQEHLMLGLGTPQPLDQAAVQRLLEQLRSNRFSTRRKAMLELKDLGSPVIPLLRDRLRGKGLDAEQRSRISRIVNLSTQMRDDTPTSLASLLSLDQKHWTIVADRLNQHQWIAANKRLRQCGLPTLSR
ncbi:MAG: hypothetical protein AAFV88_15410 [Planctomycetota bacterium]